MQFSIKNPSKAFVVNSTREELVSLAKQLSYKNTANAHLLKRHYNNKWARSKNRDAWEARTEELKKAVNKICMFQEEGKVYIRPGSLSYIGVSPTDIESAVVYPTPKKAPWAKTLPFILHPYQSASVENLIAERHANVELCTGAGKSAILLAVCRETGFRTCIVAPSRSIFNELLEKFELHLGKANVGAFGDGKKRIGKKFTVCIGDSLCNVKPGTPEWDFFSNLDMIDR